MIGNLFVKKKTVLDIFKDIFTNSYFKANQADGSKKQSLATGGSQSRAAQSAQNARAATGPGTLRS